MPPAVAEPPKVAGSRQAAAKVIRPGTLGWTVDDLLDDDYEWETDGRRFEIADGILVIHDAVKPRRHKRICPGTYGWTVEDFADEGYGWHAPENERRRFEIADGILVEMPPVGDQTGGPPDDLRTFLTRLLPHEGFVFRTEVDLLLLDGDPQRVVRPDLAVYAAQSWREQKRWEAEQGLDRLPRKYRPIRVMPALVVESISDDSIGYDKRTKRGWYAEAEIPHYWLLDAKDRSLTCLVLEGRDYREEAVGTAPNAVDSSAFGGVRVPLAEVWPE